jgi:hypothetical protein
VSTVQAVQDGEVVLLAFGSGACGHRDNVERALALALCLHSLSEKSGVPMALLTYETTCDQFCR